MKKIIIALLLVTCVVMGVTACNNKGESEETTAATTAQTTAATTKETLTEKQPAGVAIDEVATAATPEERFASNPALLIWEGTETASAVVPYLCDGNAGTIILVQGIGEDGGYYISEGEPVAKMLNARGYDVFVCKYSLGDVSASDIVGDVRRAVKFVRYYAAEFGVDGQKLGLMGFGEGAWLAYVENCDNEISSGVDVIDAQSAKADLLLMVNPVISPNSGALSELLPASAPDRTSSLAVFYESDVPNAAEILNFVFSLKSEHHITTVEVHSINDTADYKAGGNRTENYKTLYDMLDNFFKIA